MTLHQKIGLSIYSFIALALIAGGAIYLSRGGVSASEMEDRGEVTWQISMTEDMNQDSKKEQIFVTSYLKEGSYRAFISTRDRWLRYRESELAGFESDLAFCPLKTITIDQEKAICVFGEVGAHAQNIQIIRWSDFSKIGFIDKKGVSNENIISDMPNFDFNYLNGDRTIIYVDNRNYEKDPLVDIIRTSYYLVNSAFKYLGEESFSIEGLIK